MKRHALWTTTLIILLSACTEGTSSSTTSKPTTTQASGEKAPVKAPTDTPKETPKEEPKAKGFDHSAWDGLLKKYVENSRVDYESWKKNDLATLDAYLDKVRTCDPDTLPDRNHKLAFWINVYNAWTIRSILEVYPTKSIREHTKKPNGFDIWDNNPIKINGKDYNLNEIEKGILLRDMKEPRVHFAVNCASIGCPPLKSSAWLPETLEKDFAANAKVYFASAINFQYDKATNTVSVSQLFDWYKADFGTDPAKVQQALAPYVSDPEAQKVMSEGKGTLKYLDYDWNLNKQS